MTKNYDKKIADLYGSGLSMKQISDRLCMSCPKVRYSLEIQGINRRNHSDSSQMLHSTKFGKKQCLVKRSFSEDEDKLRIAGTMLYWGEGTKQGGSVVFSNSDPQMIRFFLSFLRTICNIDEKRLRILLHIYDDQKEDELKKFWSKITDIPKAQYSKTTFHRNTKGTYKKKSVYGTVSLRYSDKKLLDIINNWISGYKMPV